MEAHVDARFCEHSLNIADDASSSLMKFEQHIQMYAGMKCYADTIQQYFRQVGVTIDLGRPNFIQDGLDIIKEYLNSTHREQSCLIKSEVLALMEMQSIRMHFYMDLFDIKTHV